jgi:hypothetical protein
MPLVWRNRGLLLLNHAINLQKQYKDGSASSILFVTLIVNLSIAEDVIQSCRDLIGSHFMAIDRLPAVIALHEEDHEGRLILRCAAIVVHTAMAILLRTLSQALSTTQNHPTFSGVDQALPGMYRRKCRKCLKEAIKITRGLADSDFPFIDVAMAVRFFSSVMFYHARH